MKRSKLIPEVRALLASGGLSPVDCEWIARLKPESQLAAAEKCLRPNFTPVGENMPNRSRLGGGNGHAGRSAE